MPHFPDNTILQPEISPLLQAVARGVQRIGVQQATVILVGLSVVASVLLTLLWHLVAGWRFSGHSFIVAALVPVPIASLCAGYTLKLIVALEQAMRRLEALAMTSTSIRSRGSPDRAARRPRLSRRTRMAAHRPVSRRFRPQGRRPVRQL